MLLTASRSFSATVKQSQGQQQSQAAGAKPEHGWMNTPVLIHFERADLNNQIFDSLWELADIWTPEVCPKQ